MTAPAGDAPAPAAEPSRGRLAAEAFLVTGVVVAPNIVWGLCDLVSPPVFADEPLAIYETRAIAHSVGWIALAAFVIGTSREPAARFGVTRPWPGRELTTAAVLLALVYLIATMFTDLAAGAGLFDLDRPLEETVRRPPDRWWEYVITAVSLTLVGFAEELVYRSVLLTRVAFLTRSAVWGLTASSVLFGLAHVYYGPGGAATVASIGFVFGAAFLWLGRVWPVALAHGGYDIVLAFWP